MTTLRRARQLALALPEATEQDHHGMASFRVRGKIFATVPDGIWCKPAAKDGDKTTNAARASAATPSSRVKSLPGNTVRSA